VLKSVGRAVPTASHPPKPIPLDPPLVKGGKGENAEGLRPSARPVAEYDGVLAP